MIEITFLILKIIGIILLSVLGIIVLCLLLLLFHPIRYAINVEVHNSKESIQASGHCKWLMGLVEITFVFLYPEFDWKGRVLFMNLNRLIPKMQSDEPVKSEKEQKLPEEKFLEKSSEECISEELKENLDAIDDDEVETKTKKNSKKTPILKKIKFTIIRICDSIKLMLERKDKLIDFLYDDTHQYTLEKCKKQLFYLFKKYKPKKLNLEGRIGFDDPSMTGKMLGVLGMMYPLYGDSLEIIPDFEEAIIDVSGVVKGKIALYPVIKIALRLIMDKKVRRTVQDIRNIEL